MHMSFTMSPRTFLDVPLLLLRHQQSQEEEQNKEKTWTPWKPKSEQIWKQNKTKTYIWQWYDNMWQYVFCCFFERIWKDSSAELNIDRSPKMLGLQQDAAQSTGLPVCNGHRAAGRWLLHRNLLWFPLCAGELRLGNSPGACEVTKKIG